MSPVPVVKGWCPGAHNPMLSGDGYLVRIRPRMGQIETPTALHVCAAAKAYGNGLIDLTSRANLQIRGVPEDKLAPLQMRLAELGLLDPDAETEARRNILVTPTPERQTKDLHDVIVAGLAQLPRMPDKMGIVLDTGPNPILQDVSGDFRFECSASGGLILRADGAATGQTITPSTALGALQDMMHWFLESGGPEQGRMAKHLKHCSLPSALTGTAPARAASPLRAGRYGKTLAYGIAFGQIEATALMDLLTNTQASTFRLTPWRILLLEDAQPATSEAFTLDPDDPVLAIHACPGAPGCLQASAETRPLARRLAAQLPKSKNLHVSGCAKGCAHPGRADVTLVAENGRFNLVPSGTAWDEPTHRALCPDDIATLLRP